MGGSNDQQNWVGFAKRVARRGFTALTFDFRCYGGSECASTSVSGDVDVTRDLEAAIGFLRERGFQRFVCIGASMGAGGCLNVAFEEELVGLVIVAGLRSGHPDRQNLYDFVSPDMAKLFIASENDPGTRITESMILMYESAPDPKILKIFPSSTHGTELFRSDYGPEFRSVMLDFLEGIRSSP